MCKIYYNDTLLEKAQFNPYEVGKQYKLEFIIENDYQSTTEYTIESTSDELVITKYPNILTPGSKGAIETTFKPKLGRRESFSSTFNIREVFR